jgi:hypothetical protein|uniref:Uncharacterized protein n=1 Tax=viral metagenome TaxID=1070528 RepID=A0A6C0HFR4_9ZZZZ
MENGAVRKSYCNEIDAILEEGRRITFSELIAWAVKPWVTSHKLNRLKFLLELYASQKIENTKEILKIEEQLVEIKRLDELAKSMSSSVPCLDLVGNEARGKAKIADLKNKNDYIDPFMAFIAEKISALGGVPPEPPQVSTTGSLNA